MIGAELRILIAEDDPVSRTLLKAYLEPHGRCEAVTNGIEAAVALRKSIEEGDPYDLLCLDILMPDMNGQDALQLIREIERENGIAGRSAVKVIMTTALEDRRNVLTAFRAGCEGYLVKPIVRENLLRELSRLHLLPAGRDAARRAGP